MNDKRSPGSHRHRPASTDDVLDLLADLLTPRIAANLAHQDALREQLRRARLKLERAIAGNRP